MLDLPFHQIKLYELLRGRERPAVEGGSRRSSADAGGNVAGSKPNGEAIGVLPAALVRY